MAHSDIQDILCDVRAGWQCVVLPMRWFCPLMLGGY